MLAILRVSVMERLHCMGEGVHTCMYMCRSRRREGGWRGG